MWIGRYEAKSTASPSHNLQWIATRIVFFIVGICDLFICSESTQIIRFTMEEEVRPGFLVGLLIKHLPDAILTGPGKLTFRSIQEGHANLFSLGPSDGRIQVAQRIDRETICPTSDILTDSTQSGSECHLTFSVNLLRLTSVGTEIVDILRIVILLMDIDDNVCYFTPSHQQIIKLPENIPHDQIPHIPLHSPCDLDTGAGNGIEKSFIRLVITPSSSTVLSIPLTPTNSEPPFKLLTNRTGLATRPFALFLVPLRSFDYETTQLYNLVIEASGANRTDDRICRLNIAVHILDQNDFAPRFTQNYSVIKIPETASLYVPIYTLSAVDSDLGPLYSQLIYDFDVHATPAVINNFRIDKYNGSIFLRNPLDYRKQAFYDIPLMVRNPFPHEVGNITGESSQVVFKPSQTQLIDRALLQVHVLDVNDQPPVISVFTPDGGNLISLREHSKDIPLDVAVVTVVDEDTGKENTINCTLANPMENRFSLVPIKSVDRPVDSKELNDVFQPLEVIYKLSALVAFDREITDYVDVKIQCEDAGSPPLRAEYTVHIRIDDVNDHAPVLNQTKVRWNVTEDSDPVRKQNGYVIGQIVATDADVGTNARLNYQLINHGQIADLFMLDNRTGLLRSTGKLDREKQSYHELEFKVIDGGKPSLTTLGTIGVHVLDYNDEAPVFDQQSYEFSMSENNALGELIGSLQATDRDDGTNAVIHFHLEPLSDRYKHLGRIQSLPGGVRTKLPFDIVSYFDTVHNTYEIRLYASQVLDREAIMKSMEPLSDYALTSDDDRGPRRDSNNGQTKPSYKFWIVGEDAGTPRKRGQALVHVFVDDVNDEVPVFTRPQNNSTIISMSYLEKIGHIIYQISASDMDAGLNGTVRYKIDQIRFHNYTKPLLSGNATHASHTKSSTRFSPNELFTLHPVRGSLRLNHQMTSADIGSIFAISLTAQDIGVPQRLSTKSILFLHIDDTVPKGNLMDDSVEYLSDTTGAYAYGNSEDGSTLNFYIIIAIVSVSFMISAILIGGICIALRRRKHAPVRVTTSQNTSINGEVIIPMMEYPMEKKLSPSVSPNKPEDGSLCELMDHTIFGKKCANEAKNLTELDVARDQTSAHMLDPVLTYGPQLMQVLNLQPCTSTISHMTDMKTLRLVCSEQDTMPRLLTETPYETNELKPNSSEATLILCASDYAPSILSTTLHNSDQQESQKMPAPDLHATVQQPVTLINYAHPLEVQHWCVHPSQTNMMKRNSLGSTDQDSGNGDSLNTPAASMVTMGKQSIWLPAQLTSSRASPPVHSLTLPLVHVYTPLSCVSENDVMAPNSNTSVE